jgi:lysozyme
MKLSFDDTKIIRKFEGFSLTAYPDPVTKGDPWTIAWGLTGPWVVPGLTLTYQEAEDQFMSRIDQFCSQLDSIIKVPVTKNQYIALLSFAWNVGIHRLAGSSILTYLNNNQYNTACDHFLDYVYAKGKYIKGLENRRKQEQILFLTA